MEKQILLKCRKILAAITVIYLIVAVALFDHLIYTAVRDLTLHKETARLSLTDPNFWSFWHGGFTIPLIYKALQNHDPSITYFQLFLACLSWISVGLVLVSQLQHAALKIVGYASVLFFSLGTDFFIWHRIISTESLNNSLTVLLAAAWMLAVRHLKRELKVQVGLGIGLAGLLIVWGFTRPPNYYTAILLAGFLLVIGIRFRLRLYIIFISIIVLTLVGIYALRSRSVNNADSPIAWKNSIMNNIAASVLPDADKRAFFAERGLPVTPEALQFAGYVPANRGGDWRPVFEEWIEEHGRQTYFEFLLSNPPARIWEVVKNWQKVLDAEVLLEMFGYTNSQHFLADWQQNALLYNPGGFSFIVLGLITFLLMIFIWRQEGYDRRWTVPLVVLLLFTAMSVITWYGDHYHARHHVGNNLMIRLSILLLCFYSVDKIILTPSPSQGSGAVDPIPAPYGKGSIAHDVRLSLPLLSTRGETRLNPLSRYWERGWEVRDIRPLLIGLLATIAVIEILSGSLWTRNHVVYPVVSAVVPEYNVLRFWGVSDDEYRLYQHINLDETILLSRTQVFDGQPYVRQYVLRWGEFGAPGEIYPYENGLSFQWRTSPQPIASAGPQGVVYGPVMLDEQTTQFLTRWRGNFLPGNLRQFEIRYVYFDRITYNALPLYQQRLLNNPSIYQPIQRWEDGILYEVVSPVLEWSEFAVNTNYTDSIEGAIFIPVTGALAQRDLYTLSLAGLIQATVPSDAAAQKPLRELMAVLEAMQFESELNLTSAQQTALSQWRETKQPQFLAEAGFDSLLVTQEWWSWLSTEEQTFIQEQYELVRVWEGEVPEWYRLYKIKNAR